MDKPVQSPLNYFGSELSAFMHILRFTLHSCKVASVLVHSLEENKAFTNIWTEKQSDSYVPPQLGLQGI